MKKLLAFAFLTIAFVCGCDTGPATGSSTPTQLTPEEQAALEAEEKAVAEEESAHQAAGG